MRLSKTTLGHRGRLRLAELYRTQGEAAGRLAYLLTGDRELARDISQEAFVRMGPRLDVIRDSTRVSSYLRKTIINLCRAHWRRQAIDRAYLKKKKSERSVAADSIAPTERDHELLDALAQLPYRQRAAIVLRYYEDLSEHQASEVLGCPVGTVKSLVSRGLSSLRIELRGEDVG